MPENPTEPQALTKQQLREAYIAFAANPANDDTTDGVFCSQAGVKPQVLMELKREQPDMVNVALEKRRMHYARELKEVDKALFEKAKSGDAKAADLVYRRFENWSPKVADENARQSVGGRMKTFAELIAEEDA